MKTIKLNIPIDFWTVFITVAVLVIVIKAFDWDMLMGRDSD